ncbi:unnamed protein product, partial [Mesorhabditis belari]|uniref:adenylate cyclase n=1 Tax=Mesorhabditis belari TaxID=2138241 RepID=A0AAF3E7W6_9BILA
MKRAFGSEPLERHYQHWKAVAAAAATRGVLIGVAVATGCSAIAHAPHPSALRFAAVSLAATGVHVAAWWRPRRVPRHSLPFACFAVLLLAVFLALPDHNALFPAIIAIFVAYTFLSLPFLFILPATMTLSFIHVAAFALLVQPMKTMELLAVLLVHVWSHFIGVYVHVGKDKIARNTFLSGKNAVETENLAEDQSQKLNRLLSAFLPLHLITATRHQIAQHVPQIYAEHYTQITTCYGRLSGLEGVLAQCSANDAARVIKEFEQRIDRLATSHGCIRIPSDGILVISSVPAIETDHAGRIIGFACDLEALVSSFRDATCSSVTVTVGVDSGPVTAGVVGRAKWHYDVIGIPVDNAVLLQNNAPADGVYITDDTRRLLGNDWKMENVGDCWRVQSMGGCPAEMFPINKRFSLVTLPQAVSRLLQTVSASDTTIGLKTIALGASKKRKVKLKGQSSIDSETTYSGRSMMHPVTLTFTNDSIEEEYQKEMDKWLIPALTISISFLVVHGIYHLLVMPRLITSVALIVISLVFLMAFFGMLYINDTFSQFVTRTSSGHSLAVLLIMALLFMCGIVNTFSCPSDYTPGVCEKIHFAAFSFAIWIIWTAVFLKIRFVLLGPVLLTALSTYVIQMFISHPPIGAKEFVIEADLLIGLILLAYLILLHARECERLQRLDFLAHVKGVEETASKDRLQLLNNQVMLNLVPAHIAPTIASKSGELWQHAAHSVGVAYLAISGFDLHGEQGLNALNYIFGYFDQALTDYKGIEKVRSSNRFYVVAAGLVPDSTRNVSETPWTVGELLYALANFLLRVTQFATERQFEVQIGMDCGSTLSVICDTEKPQYELWGETVERARLLMQSACHEKIMASEEIYLALRPRQFNFSSSAAKIAPNLNAYLLKVRDDDDTVSLGIEQRSNSPEYHAVPQQSISIRAEFGPDMSRRAEEKHTMNLFQKAQQNGYPEHTELLSSICSSFSSDLHSIDAGGETDSDIEWITPETALMGGAPMRVRPIPPLFAPPGYKPETNYLYSDCSEAESSRNPSRMSGISNGDRGPSRQSKTSKSSRGRRWRRNPWMKKGHSSMSTDAESAGEQDAAVRLEAAAHRVDRMLRELNAYGDFATSSPGNGIDFPFPTQIGSTKSIDVDRVQKRLKRAVSSTAHTEYDNAESERGLSDCESRAPSRQSRRTPAKQKRKRWFSKTKKEKDGCDADMESQCSSMASSLELDPLRWKSVHSIGYENEYELQSEVEGLCVEEMRALSRDIRKNFGDYELANFEDIDAD